MHTTFPTLSLLDDDQHVIWEEEGALMERVSIKTGILLVPHKLWLPRLPQLQNTPYPLVSLHCFNLSKLAHFLPSSLFCCFARNKANDHLPSTKAQPLGPQDICQHTGSISEIRVCIILYRYKCYLICPLNKPVSQCYCIIIFMRKWGSGRGI